MQTKVPIYNLFMKFEWNNPNNNIICHKRTSLKDFAGNIFSYPVRLFFIFRFLAKGTILIQLLARNSWWSVLFVFEGTVTYNVGFKHNTTTSSSLEVYRKKKKEHLI